MRIFFCGKSRLHIAGISRVYQVVRVRILLIASPSSRQKLARIACENMRYSTVSRHTGSNRWPRGLLLSESQSIRNSKLPHAHAQAIHSPLRLSTNMQLHSASCKAEKVDAAVVQQRMLPASFERRHANRVEQPVPQISRILVPVEMSLRWVTWMQEMVLSQNQKPDHCKLANAVQASPSTQPQK